MDEDGFDNFEDEFDVEEENNEGEDVAKGDGLADMMSKILNQKVGDKVPVLAKRKTALMKEMEGSHVDFDRLKRQRAEKKAEKEKQLVVPDLTSADFERQLRKLATRGVVALFNAIAKTKKEAAEKEAAEKSQDKPAVAEQEINRTDVKQMTHENFLAMLKGQKDDEKVMEDFQAATGNSRPNKRGKEDREERDEREAREARLAKSKASAPSSSSGDKAGAGGATGGITWNALKDDYPLAGQSMALKDWDKDDSDDDSHDEDDDRVEDGISDMKEGGLRMTSSADMEQLQNRKQLAMKKKK